MSLSFLSKKSVLLVVLSLLIHVHMNKATESSLKNVSTDHVALLAIKSKITVDPQGVFKSWNDSLPFCAWQGVTCSRRHQRVTLLNLTGKGLVGSLSPYIGNLSFLRYMIFRNNQLYGSIPSEIGLLHRLQGISLPNNSLTGEIPVTISNCSKLLYIDLHTNKLSGKIPNIFTSLSIIKNISLSQNEFTGGIPPSIGNLSSLEQLYISICPLLGGNIPNSFNHLKNLRGLGLGNSGLIGAFPLFLFNISTLERINIPQNQLRGSFPLSMCLNQPHLRRLEIAFNQFSGLLPPSISNCSELETMDVGENGFIGEIAIDFGKLQYLSYLSFGTSNFESLSKGRDGMRFLDSLSNCSNLNTLELGNNQLTGVLPNSIGNFSSKLQYLSLYSNYIFGPVSPSIGNLLGLTTLNIGINNFSGMIPESIGKLQNLVKLNLELNAFSGIIPRSLGNLSSVMVLAIGGNKLEDTIPSTIGNCTKLISLDLRRNILRGSVPKELFQLSSLSIGLYLSQNNLSGVLPHEIGNLDALGYLDLSKNRLSGELPSSFSSCISLQTLNLSGNLFNGSMPTSLSTLRGLEYVDLSQNNFSGPIPMYLQEMALKKLNLSYNDFEGDVSVKGVFANTSAISLIGNHRLCGGIPELHLKKCITTNTKRSGKLSVSGVVAISLSSTVVAVALVSFVLFYFCKNKNNNKPSGIQSMESFARISYGRLFKATEGFSSVNLIGAGSFASVYRGVFDENGLTVAIKVLNLQRRGGHKSFMAECDALRNIRHRNLVKLLTSCSSLDFHGNDFKALVYEFMPNGSLESWLHSTEHKLDIVQRISIIKDVACALEYLHCCCEKVVVHCDLKPNNILLDGDMVAHVGDFGLAKILSVDEVSNTNKSSSTLIRGTIGYAPPEYGLGNEVSTNGDIYSFGILLLELLTGKKPVDPMFKEGLSLHSYARTALSDGLVLQIVDPVLLKDDVDEKSLISLAKIGVLCSSESPQDRMDIETVVRELFLITFTTRSTFVKCP